MAFRNKNRAIFLKSADQRLREAVERLWGEAPLLDVETGQFHHFCKMIGDTQLQFVAIKGPSNIISKSHLHTKAVLEKAIHRAVTAGQGHQSLTYSSRF